MARKLYISGKGTGSKSQKGGQRPLGYKKGNPQKGSQKPSKW